MFTLAFLTDPHLAPLPRPSLLELASKRILGYLNWQASRKTFHNRDVLNRLCADMLAQNADHIAVGGDLVNLSLRDEFPLALDWLQSLGSPKAVSVVPGNHDAYVRMKANSGMALWSAYMASSVEGLATQTPSTNGFPWVRQFGKVALIGLSTAVPTPPFFAYGKLGAEQLDALARVLERFGSSGFYRIVMVHHPPLVGMSGLRRGLRDAEDLQDTLERNGAELVLYGHRHVSSLDTLAHAGGKAFVVGGASASAAHGAPEELARYYLFRIEQESGRWSCEMVARGTVEPEGSIVEIVRKSLTA